MTRIDSGGASTASAIARTTFPSFTGYSRRAVSRLFGASIANQ